MNRKEFIDALEGYLGALPSEEKNDAINYYKELFDDAGKENEQSIIDGLGDPKDISKQILLENGISSDPEPEFMPDTINENYNGQNYSEHNTAGPEIEDIIKPASVKDHTTAILIIIILVLTAPVWSGIVIGLLGAIFGIIVGIFAALLALSISGIVLIAVGVYTLFQAPPIGLMLFGSGLIISGLASLIVKPILKGFFKLMVMFINWLVSLAKKIINKEINKGSVQ